MTLLCCCFLSLSILTSQELKLLKHRRRVPEARHAFWLSCWSESKDQQIENLVLSKDTRFGKAVTA